jgi:hypothetical protein
MKETVRARPYLAKTVLSLIVGLLLSTPAMADPVSFEFGFSPSITVIANQTTSIAAAIINTSNIPLDFGCAFVTCGGLRFGVAADAGPGEGLDALNLSFGSFSNQFAGLVLAPFQRFDFTFGTIDFDPSVTLGNPFGNVLHPTFSFYIDRLYANVPSTISVGDQVSFSPLTFVSAPEPEPSSFALLVTGMLALLAFAARRRTAKVSTRTPGT